MIIGGLLLLLGGREESNYSGEPLMVRPSNGVG